VPDDAEGRAPGVHLEVNLFKGTWGSEPVLPRADWTVVDLNAN
jgi:hypothetical protein